MTQQIGDRTRLRIGGAGALEVRNGSVCFLGLEFELGAIAIGVREIRIQRYCGIGGLFRLIESRCSRRSALLDQGFGNKVIRTRVFAFPRGRLLKRLDGPVQVAGFKLRESHGQITSRIGRIKLDSTIVVLLRQSELGF